jgi:hypothetical protein
MFATFYNARGETEEGSVRMHHGSWTELLANVKQIKVTVDYTLEEERPF